MMGGEEGGRDSALKDLLGTSEKDTLLHIPKH